MKDKIFLVFLDDDGKKKEGWFDKVRIIKDALVSFETNDNKVIIPIHRVLKMKTKLKGGQNKI